MHAPPPDDRVPFKAYVISGAGLLCVGAVMFVSASLNWSFGHSLGRTPFDATIYGIASVAADGFKCLAPFFFFAAIKNRMWSNAIAAFAVWAMTTVYALTGAFGHAALNRTDTSSKREVASGEYAALVKERGRIEQEIAWIPQHRPAATVAAEIEAKKTERMFRLTNGCAPASITSGAGRSYCTDLHKLEAERASATQGADLRGRLDRITAQLRPYASTGATTKADPQVAELSKLTGIEASHVTTLMLLLVVGLLEIVSGLGLYAVMSNFPDRPTPRRVKEEQAQAETEDVATAEPVAAPKTENIVSFPKKPMVSEEVQPLKPSVSPVIVSLPYDKQQAEADLRSLLANLGHIPSQDVLGVRWGVAKGTVSKWLHDWSWVEIEKTGRRFNRVLAKPEALIRVAA